ncbi:TRAP transporter small permease [Ramlibacter sp.]|uniref:TRAP transporter small permease n=1 Tax=Ramlibacter sp. TaxID=1917967 RepID=UPI0035AD7F6C
MRKEASALPARALEAVGVVALAVLMLVVLVDVAGRNLFNRPLPWGTELLEVVLAVMVFALYPLLALRATHIVVDLIPVPAALRLPQRLLSALVGAVLFGVIAYCTGRQAVRSATYGDASALLKIPTAWVLWGMCALSVVTALAFLVAAWRRDATRAAVHGVALD